MRKILRLARRASVPCSCWRTIRPIATQESSIRYATDCSSRSKTTRSVAYRLHGEKPSLSVLTLHLSRLPRCEAAGAAVHRADVCGLS